MELESDYEHGMESGSDYEHNMESEPDYERNIELESDYEQDMESKYDYKHNMELESDHKHNMESESDYQQDMESESDNRTWNWNQNLTCSSSGCGLFAAACSLKTGHALWIVDESGQHCIPTSAHCRAHLQYTHTSHKYELEECNALLARYATVYIHVDC